MTYPGGKSGAGVYQTIINQLPPHRVYIEPFLGGGAILRLKRPAACSIGIDSDSDVITAFPGDAVPNLTLIHADAVSWLANTIIPGDALIYLDPPYLMDTRRQQRPIYRCELYDDQHRQLLEVIRGLRCPVAISGYWSEMYAQALAGWRLVQFEARTRGGSMATECLWMNYPEPLELHDYRYLGGNFRERERIKRKQARWRKRLQTMPAQERYAMLSVIAELRTIDDNARNNDAGECSPGRPPTFLTMRDLNAEFDDGPEPIAGNGGVVQQRPEPSSLTMRYHPADFDDACRRPSLKMAIFEDR